MPKCLDLFCCAGGAGVGYHRAGFEVTGVDLDNHSNYPFKLIQTDALQYLAEHGHEYDMVHASPPCQGYSKHVSSRSSKFVPTLGKDEPRLISEVRKLLGESGRVYVIENVMGAKSEMRQDLILCGSMFGLPVQRHRIFESNCKLIQPPHPKCRGIGKKFAADNGWNYRDMSVTGKGRNKGTSDRWKQIMGIDWEMTQAELAEAIPPSYTEYIGKQLKIQAM